MCYELHVTVECTEQGVIVTSDELNAVASSATEEEALRNLEQAIEALMQGYGEEVRKKLKERVLKVTEVV